MRKIVSLFLFCLFSLSYGQSPVGTWTDHLVYNTAKNIALGGKEIFVSTGSSLFIYNNEYDELRKLSRVNGLSETGISTIAWSDEYQALIIAYTNANVDIIRDNVIYNIADIYRKYIPGRKEIKRIRTSGKYAYLACSFGIVVIDIVKKEIFDTWKPLEDSGNAEINDIALGNGKVYAVTGQGVYSADISEPGLAYYGNWTPVTSLPDPSGIYTAALFSDNVLYLNRSDLKLTGDTVFRIGNNTEIFSYSPGVVNLSFDCSNNGFTITSKNFVNYYKPDGSLNKSISSSNWGEPDFSQAVSDINNIWIADRKWGLLFGENMSSFSSKTLPGPVSLNCISISSLNGKTVICGGGVDNSWNNLWRPMQVSIRENNSWSSFQPGNITDPMRILIDPADNNHLFISTWGKGLLEYENNVLVNNYTETNSPLKTIIAGKPYVRICGLAMDKNRDLWITQSGVPGSIKILRSNGSWIENPVTIETPTIGDIIITRNGLKWIILPRGYGLFILDDNDTPDYFSDDRYKKMLVTDSENNVVSNVYSIAEDLEGNIWVGTDQGPLIYFAPEKVFNGDLKAFRPKISRNDGSGLFDYLLKSETITSIAVDGADRKWLGTMSAGAFLISPDGTEKILSFNDQNSPLLSNTLSSIAVDNKTGDVFFATSNGVISYRGDATAGMDKFTGVYSFPNPVREDFDGNVTITGLMKDSEIKITDISGNLVYETISTGGEASWNIRTYNGERVSTGVYLVFCSSSDGTQSCVVKILVI